MLLKNLSGAYKKLCFALSIFAYENLKSRTYFGSLRIGEPLTGGRAAVHPASV
jgi:hypothetical protein